ncbi:hypothetical protein Tco_0073737 [Tanacetum coccineum]
MVLHGSDLKSSVVETSEKKESDDEPPVKKLKFLIPPSLIPLLTPLNSIPPEPIPRTEITKMSFDQFSKHLTQTTSSIFSPTPPREPTPPRDESKGKGITSEEPLKDLIPYIEKEGYVPNIPKLESFITLDKQLTQEDIMAQVKEMKRLADLKVEKEKINSSHEASIGITRENDPLNIVVHKNFRLNTLRFSEWLEVHALASKITSKSNNQLLKNLRDKFQWVISQAQNLGVPPLLELANFGISMDDKKRKRISKILQEVFVKEDIVVDEMHRNLIPPLEVKRRKGLVIREPESGVIFYNMGSKGLVECIASESNLRRIQVTDIVKEFKDQLKTYSSAGMDISSRETQ